MPSRSSREPQLQQPLGVLSPGDQADEFYLAAGRGDLPSVSALLAAGQDVDTATGLEFHRTALMAAAMTDQAEAARLLLAHGAALDVRDRELGCTAIILAAQQRSSRVLRLLAESGARLNVFNAAGYSALFWCVENGDATSAQLLLDSGADADRQNRDGVAALHLCCAFGRIDIARALLDAGAGPDPVSCELHGRHTPLTLAAAKQSAELLALLATHGADLDHAAEEGTALALARGRPDIVACLEGLIRSRLLAERRRSSVATPAAVTRRASARARQSRRATAAAAATAGGARPRSALPSGLYPTSARPRGFCLLASNSRFSHEPDFPALPGSEERAAVLTEVFSDLGLLIRPAVGLSGADLLLRAQRLAAADHTRADLLVCVFLTYGVGGGVVGSDGRPADVGQLVDCFCPASCPGLAGKPKLFLFLLSAAPRARSGPECAEPAQADSLLAYAVAGCGGGVGTGCARLTAFLRRLRRALDTESEHVDFGRLFLLAGERLRADCDSGAGGDQQLLLEVRHSLDRQLVFR